MKIKLATTLASALCSVTLLSTGAEAARHHSKPRRLISHVQNNAVISMITAQASSYGVPTWFALRIAKIESNYNPLARGLAGEYGVFQLKCQTARGIGFRGNCAGLLNASTNVHYGLKYLSMAPMGCLQKLL